MSDRDQPLPQRSTALKLYHLSALGNVSEHAPLHGLGKLLVFIIILPLLPVVWAFWPLLFMGELHRTPAALVRVTLHRELRWLVWMRLLARIAARCPNAEVVRSLSNNADRVNNLFQGYAFHLKLSPWPDTDPGETLEIGIDHERPPEEGPIVHKATVTLRSRGERLSHGLARALKEHEDLELSLRVEGKRHVHAVGELLWELPEHVSDVHADEHPVLARAGEGLAEVVDSVLRHANLNPAVKLPGSPERVSVVRATPDSSCAHEARTFMLRPSSPLPVTRRSYWWLRLLYCDPINAMFLATVAAMVMVGMVASVAMLLAQSGFAALMLAFVVYVATGAKLLGGRLLTTFGSSAERRWNRDALAQPLTLTSSGELRTEEARVDMSAPFQVTLSHAPNTPGRLHVHLSQRDDVGDVNRITVATRCDSIPPETPALDTLAPWIEPGELARYLWPAIQHHAALHDAPPLWGFAVTDGTSRHASEEHAVSQVEASVGMRR